MSVVAVEHVSLDGVMQAPARADEDTRGGFSRGGWSPPYGDQVMAEIMGGRMAGGTERTSRGEGGLLLGRRTYADFAAVWPSRAGNPVAERLTASRKYVASRTLTEPLPWANSVLLADAVAQVGQLRRDTDLTVLGSGELVRSLLAAGLIDELLLCIHPLVLGQGRRLFPESGPYAALTLTGSRPTTTGVIIATYQPVT